MRSVLASELLQSLFNKHVGLNDEGAMGERTEMVTARQELQVVCESSHVFCTEWRSRRG